MDGDDIGEIRLREELDDDLEERDIYGLGGDISVVISNGEVAIGEIGDLRLSPATGKSPNPGINTSVPKSSVKGRGGGRSTMASKSLTKNEFIFVALSEFFKILRLTSFRNSSPAYSPSISAGPNNTVPFLNTSPSSATQLRDLLTQRHFLLSLHR